MTRESACHGGTRIAKALLRHGGPNPGHASPAAMKAPLLVVIVLVSSSLTARAQTSIAFTYDADGGRLKKAVGATTTVYPFGDGYEVTDGVVTKYVLFAGEAVAKRVGNATHWVHPDVVSSVQAVSSPTGASLQRLAYRPFGAPLATATNYPEALSFTGQRQDESGLFYLHARYYDPQLARFVGPDEVVPSFSNVGLNRYSYAINDPIDHTDISGFGPDTPWSAFWGSIGSGLKDIGITAGRIVVEPATLAYDLGGYAVGIANPYYNHQPVSFSGQAYDGVQFGSKEQLMVAANAQANIWSLGGYGTIQGAREYAATGDPSAFRQAATGQLMATTGAWSAVRASQARAQASMQSRMAAMERWANQQDMEGIGAGSAPVNPTGCTTNCVASAIAGDSTMAGRPASARPMASGADAFHPANLPDLRPNAMMLEVSGEVELTNIMARSGDGARAIVIGRWLGSERGHALNVINRGGRVHYIDFQSGQTVAPQLLNQMWNLQFLRTN
jgi:RHS repeat-associated protein